MSSPNIQAIPSAVDPPFWGVGRPEGDQVERLTSRTTWSPSGRSARLARVDGGRDGQVPPATPAVRILAFPEPEAPAGGAVTAAPHGPQLADGGGVHERRAVPGPGRLPATSTGLSTVCVLRRPAGLTRFRASRRACCVAGVGAAAERRTRALAAARAARSGRLEDVQKVLPDFDLGRQPAGDTRAVTLAGRAGTVGMVMEEHPEELRTKVYGERMVYDNPWVRLTLVDIEPPDGQRFEHHVVRLQTVVLAMVLDATDRVLMLWRHRFVTDEWGWELPGGIADGGEDLASTAIREVVEETGWRPSEVEHLVTFQPMPGMVDTPHVVYLGRNAVKVGEPSDREEAGRVDWVPLASIPDLIAKGDVLGSGSLVGLLYLLATRARDSTTR